MIVQPATTSRTKRLATMIAAVLVLIVTAMPAAAVCCLDKAGHSMATMQAAMPCCAEQCTMSNPNTDRDQDVTMTAAPASPVPTAIAAQITATPATHAMTPAPAMERAADSYSAPPPFLINSQFRI